MSSLLKRSDAALAVGDAPQEAWRDPEWQKLWLVMRQTSWSSLAIVPAAAGGPANFTLTVAVTLARIGMMHLGQPIHVADATTIPLVHLVQFADELKRLKADGEFVLIALAPFSQNAITTSLAQAADSAVLCIMLEAMASSEAKTTVERIGPARFLGSVVFTQSGGIAAPTDNKR